MPKPATRILCTIGTRPEAIKMAPVVLALRGEGWAQTRVLAAAQHRDLLDQVLGHFEIAPDRDLDVMRDGQTLADLTARLLEGLDRVLAEEAPDLVLAQGDTTTVLAASLACHYRRIAFGHVEAGLRTGNLSNPFPEEANRQVAARLARWHFAPTRGARDNLLREGIHLSRIAVTGNTGIDALLATASRAGALPVELEPGRRLVLATVHRRESFGAPLRAIFAGLADIAAANPDVTLMCPVHPNPNVEPVARELLEGYANVVLTAPLGYGEFVAALQRAHIVITDSGGVQEEAPALAKPVLVVRTQTERPEAVALGAVKLVGTDRARIAAEAQALLDDPAAHAAMARGVSPYGDGKAAARIVGVLRRAFG